MVCWNCVELPDGILGYFKLIEETVNIRGITVASQLALFRKGYIIEKVKCECQEKKKNVRERI